MKLLRRRFPRFKIDASAQLVAGGAQKAVLKLVDVSIQGMRGITPHKLDVNGEVEILLAEPAVKRPMLKKAQVVWTRPTDDDQCEAGFSIQHLELDNFCDSALHQQRNAFPSFSVYEAGPGQSAASAEVGSAHSGWNLQDAAIIGLCTALIVGGLLRMPAAEPLRTVGSRAAAVVSRMFANIGRDRFNLEGVVYEPQGLKYITVNGQIIGEGESLNNVLVKKIGIDSVVLERNGRDQVIETR